MGWQSCGEDCGDISRKTMQCEKRLKILFFPAWYPSEVNPISGIFIREHARAASLHNDVVALYVYPDLSPRPRNLYRVTEDVEDGIRTIRVKYREYQGIFVYAKRLCSETVS